MKDNKFKIGQLQKDIKQAYDVIPKVLASQAVNYFLKSFTDQGFDGKKWKEVQRRIPGTDAYRYPKMKDLGRRKRNILIGGIYNRSGVHLRSAVANSIKVATFKKIRLEVNLPYAAAQNDGDRSMNLAARPYMKHTVTLGKMQSKVIDNYINKAFNKF